MPRRAAQRLTALLSLLLGCASADLEPGSDRPCSSPLLREGCPEHSPASSEAPKEVALEVLPAELAALFCGASASCCEQAGRSLDRVACVRATEAAYLEEFASLLAFAVRYDAAAAGRCVRSRRALYGRCDMPSAEQTDDPCVDVFRGELLAGAACESDVECARIAGASALCEPLGGSLDGSLDGSEASVCQPRAAAGGTCFGDSCQTDLYCDLFTASCQPRKQTGACPIITACASNAACSPDGECEPKKALGEPCRLAFQCQSEWCNGGFCEKPLGSAAACDG